jgi:hypothetical protein
MDAPLSYRAQPGYRLNNQPHYLGLRYSENDIAVGFA